MYSPIDNYNINVKGNKEESNIYKLVELISLIQKKISELTKSMEHTKKNELYQKLSLIEDEILKNKKSINNYIAKQKQNEINLKKKKFDNELIIKKIDNDLDEINERINNIVSGRKNNDKEIYQISNQAINKLLSQKKNENELKNLNIEYNTIISIYQNLLNVLEVNINKRYQLWEELNMLKEEKSVSEEKIIEYISKKESLEEVLKIYLMKFINEILSDNFNIDFKEKLTEENNINEENKIENTNIIRVNSSQNNNIIEPSNGAHTSLLNNKNVYISNNFQNFNITNDNFKIYLYELHIIDFNSLCKEIAIQLILSINSCLHNCNINYKTLSNSLFQNSVNNNDKDLSKSKIIYNAKDKNSFISLISSKIKKEILTFLNDVSINQNENFNKENYQKIIDDFFINLSKKIINYLNYHFLCQFIIKQKEEISSEISNIHLFLSLYLKLSFKKFYLDKLIQNECHFINNQAKNIERNIKYFIELSIANINKLNNKKQEYVNKIEEIKHKKKMIQEKVIHDNVHLSIKDKAYFDLTKQSNELIENKNLINDEFKSLEKEYEQENQRIYKKLLNREKNIKDLEEEKLLIEEKIAKKNKIIMNEIKKLKKIISEKFKMIKLQIDIYKKKYGNNTDLYDRFIEKINKSLRLTSKSLMNKNDILLNRTFSNNFYTPNNNVIPKNMIKNTFYTPNYNNKEFKPKKTNYTTLLFRNQRTFSKDSIFNFKNNSINNKI